MHVNQILVNAVKELWNKLESSHCYSSLKKKGVHTACLYKFQAHSVNEKPQTEPNKKKKYVHIHFSKYIFSTSTYIYIYRLYNIVVGKCEVQAQTHLAHISENNVYTSRKMRRYMKKKMTWLEKSRETKKEIVYRIERKKS